MTRHPTWHAGSVALLLVTGCGTSADMTAIRVAEVRERADAGAAEAGRLPLGARVRVKMGGLLQPKGWARIDGAEAKGWVPADRLAPFPIAGEAAFVSALLASVRDAPGDGARAVTALKIGARVQLSRATPVAADGHVAVLQDGVVTGFLDATAVAAEPASSGKAVAASLAALGKGQRGDALIGAEYAAALDPPSAAALELLASLVADTDPERAETLRARAASPAIPDDASPRPPTQPGPAFVWTRTAALREAPLADAPVRLHLPIGASVEVAAVAGPFAEVRVAPRPGRRFVVELRSLQELGTVQRFMASPVDAPPTVSTAGPLVGYVRVAELSVDRPDPVAITRSARAAARARDAGRALALAASAWALAPLDGDSSKLLEETALASGRTELALRPEAVLGFAGASQGEPEIDVAVFPGCRGSLARAVEVELADPLAYLTSASSFGARDLRASGVSPDSLPRDACLVAMPNPPCSRDTVEHDFEVDGEEEPTAEELDGFMKYVGERVGEMKKEHARRLAKYERWRKRTDAVFPPRPVVRVRIRNESPEQRSPPRRLFVYGYSYEDYAPPRALPESLVIARLPAPVLPPFSSIELWFPVPTYTGVAYGVVEAVSEEDARARVSALPIRARWRQVQEDLSMEEKSTPVSDEGGRPRWEASTQSTHCYQWVQ